MATRAVAAYLGIGAVRSPVLLAQSAPFPGRSLRCPLDGAAYWLYVRPGLQSHIGRSRGRVTIPGGHNVSPLDSVMVLPLPGGPTSRGSGGHGPPTRDSNERMRGPIHKDPARWAGLPTDKEAMIARGGTSARTPQPIPGRSLPIISSASGGSGGHGPPTRDSNERMRRPIHKDPAPGAGLPVRSGDPSGGRCVDKRGTDDYITPPVEVCACWKRISSSTRGSSIGT
jgi:hypothetical protein